MKKIFSAIGKKNIIIISGILLIGDSVIIGLNSKKPNKKGLLRFSPLGKTSGSIPLPKPL